MTHLCNYKILVGPLSTPTMLFTFQTIANLMEWEYYLGLIGFILSSIHVDPHLAMNI